MVQKCSYNNSVNRVAKTEVLYLCAVIISMLWCLPVYGETTGEPVVVKTNPAVYATDINPSIKEITVTFDQPMSDAWSWTGSGAMLPRMTAPPSYDQAGTTCSLPVTLEAGKVYRVGINDQSRKNFKNRENKPAKQYVIVFATKAGDGTATAIPENILQEAKAINAKSTVSAAVAVPAAAPPAEPAAFINADIPDINNFSAFQRELNRINIETRSEEQLWLGSLDQKTELARAIEELIVAELRFIQKLAESENAEQTVKAVELVLRQRQERLNNLITKINDGSRQERLQQTPERRQRRTPRTDAMEQTERRPRRAREPNSVGQQY